MFEKFRFTGFSPYDFNFLPSTRILLNGDLRKIFRKILK